MEILIFIVLKSVCSRAMASKTPVGFIGLGNMGNPMAKNLIKHGYPVIAYDVFPEACKEFQDLGAQVESSWVGEKSNYLSAYFLGGEEGYSERRGRNEKEKGGKEIDHIKEAYLPAIYPGNLGPVPASAIAFVKSVNTPETHFISHMVGAVLSECLKRICVALTYFKAIAIQIVVDEGEVRRTWK
uniref:3-hydroxyisobutyrate dehydrogenase n=1 Tax=Pavo cristatus TaxID=9049 RepID=A0A8C9FEH2_PAVCR